MFNRRLLSLTLALGLVLGLTSLASANIPDGTVSLATSGTGTLYIAPGGGGETLASVGATITVTVNATGPVPIANYPFQDIWVISVATPPADPLADVGGYMIQCNGGSAADANTDVNGQATISGTIAGGGQVYPSGTAGFTAGLRVSLAGIPVTGGANNGILDIAVNSPDISTRPGTLTNLKVDLGDIGPFSTDLKTVYDFRSDYFDDGTINLADIGIFSVYIGDVCP
jgi:hypothetical protein